MLIDEKAMIAVCAECFTAACWQGEIMCESSWDADVTTAPVWILRGLELEDDEFWYKDQRIGLKYNRRI